MMWFRKLLMASALMCAVLPAEPIPAFDAAQLFYRVDYDAMQTAIAQRLQDKKNQKNVQMLLLGASVLGMTGAWMFWPARKERAENDADAGGLVPRVEPRPSPLRALFNNATTTLTLSFVTVFGYALAQQVSSDLIGPVRRFVRDLWCGKDNCGVYESLMRLALNSYDCVVLRYRGPIAIVEAPLRDRYEAVIRSCERFVIELAADTIYRAEKRGISCYGLDQLLTQFVSDVDATNSKLEHMEKPLDPEVARGRTLCDPILETVGHIQDLRERLARD